VNRRSVAVFVVALGMLGWLSSGYIWRLWTIRNVVIEGGERITGDDVRRMIDIGVGDNLFRADLYAITDRLEQHPWIQSAVVSRRFPDLYIVIQERQPFVLVQLSGRGLVWSDAQGVVLDPYDASGRERPPTPVVTGLQPLGEGDRVGSPEVWRLVRTLLRADFSSLSGLERIHVNPGGAGVDVLTGEGVKLRLPTVGALRALRRLRSIWPTLQKKVSLQTVDLRFADELIYEQTRH